MDTLLKRFNLELKNKLSQRTSSNMTEEATLLKAFKFFDLQNSGNLSKNEFFRGLAKVGVVPELQETDQLFDHFIGGQGNKINYKEFTQSILGLFEDQNTPQIQQQQARYQQPDQISNYSRPSTAQQPISQEILRDPVTGQINQDDLFERVREKLTEKGESGLLGLALMIKSSDQSGKKLINQSQLINSLRDYGIKENPQRINTVFVSLDKSGKGFINYEDFIQKLKFTLSYSRKQQIQKVFQKLDKANSGAVNTQYIKNSFKASSHPDIKYHRSEEEINLQFRRSFESYLDFQDIGDDKVTKEDFIDYFSFLSHLWKNDEKFISFMEQVWQPDWRKEHVLYDSPDRNDFSPVQSKTGQERNDNQSNQDRRSQANLREQREGEMQYLNKSNKQSDNNSNARNQDFKSQNNEPKQFDKQSQSSQQIKRKGDNFDTQSRCSQATSTKFMQENNVSQRQIELILLRIKNRLATKGARGFLSLERLLNVTDVDNDGLLNQNEFRKAVRDYRIDVTDSEIVIIFNLFDPEETGRIDIIEFLNSLRGQMNQGRFTLVCDVFNKLDLDERGFITIGDIEREYYPRAHPNVKTTKQHEDDVSEDFYFTLNLHNKLYNGEPKREISRNQFLDYYNNVSASIPDDQFFESILVNTFRLSQQNSLVSQYAGQRNAFDPAKKGFLQDHHRFMINGGTVSSNAPFGTSQEPTLYSTQQRPYSTNSQASSMRGSPVKQTNLYPQQNRSNQQSDTYSNASDISPITDLIKRLRQRGVRGFISLYKKFDSLSIQNQDRISLQDFVQGLNELRLQVDNPKAIFDQFQRQGSLDLEFLFKALKGKIQENRQALIVQAFQGMDRNRSGEITFEALKNQFNGRDHPSVISGKQSEDEIYDEFIDTFEFHLQTFNKTKLNQGLVHFNEFFEFYHILSQTIQDDQLFEAIMASCWGI